MSTFSKWSLIVLFILVATWTAATINRLETEIDTLYSGLNKVGSVMQQRTDSLLGIAKILKSNEDKLKDAIEAQQDELDALRKVVEKK